MSQEGKRCTTVLMFTGASDNEFDFDRIVSMVVAAFASAKAHTIAEEFGASSAKTLEVEKVDEPARRAVLFSKMMLLNARDSLGKLTSQSIAELKSYKRPPASISRILKGVLYLFGKKPKELGDWNDILKSVNMELLKSMTDFDPTAKHKKRIFKRLEKVLKSKFSSIKFCNFESLTYGQP